MKTALFVQSARSPGGRRKGLTLMEILIAVGVTMLGMVGVLALFPVAIRSIQEAVYLSLAAPAAKSLIVSLTHYSLDLGAVNTDIYRGQLERDGSFGFTADADIELWRGSDSTGAYRMSGNTISAALAAYHAAEVAADRGGIGNGHSAPSFRIPDDLLNRAVIAREFGGDALPLRWFEAYGRHKDLGLTAVFVPIPINDDGDELADEDPIDGIDNDEDGLFDEDPVGTILSPAVHGVTDTSIYSVQVAVWDNYRLIADIDDGVEGEFSFTNPRQVIITEAGGEFWRKVRPGDYIRHNAHGIWHKIEALDESTLTVLLTQEFKHPTLVKHGDLLGSAPVDLASRFRLVSLHEGVVGR